MRRRGRVATLVAVTALVVGGSAAFAVRDAQRFHRRYDSAPVVDQAAHHAAVGGARIVFRHTGIDDHNGVVATVPLDHPGGPRAFTSLTCDRVDATDRAISCLRTLRGVVTRYELDELDARGRLTSKVSLPGAPSRTRLSPDSSRVATTTFVSGHAYMQVGFSTVTEIRDVDGRGHGDLEDFQLVVDGQRVNPTDRNIWGVTFAAGDAFYATAATGGRTYLVRGDLGARTLTSVRENAECPSLSPDGTRVAYKVDDAAPGTHWSFAVLDLATGRQRVLRGARSGVDDQVEWLDDDTILYGRPRPDQPGVSDVWSLDTRPGARPRLLIEQASSPAVVRP